MVIIIRRLVCEALPQKFVACLLVVYAVGFSFVCLLSVGVVASYLTANQAINFSINRHPVAKYLLDGVYCCSSSGTVCSKIRLNDVFACFYDEMQHI
jgi:hypothetical protein